MLWKSLRLAGQFAGGYLRVTLRFPGLPREGQQQEVRQWAQRVLAILGIEVQTGPLPPADFAGLVVSNHLSWLDVLVLQSLMPVTFVAKQEVRRWPVVGYLAQACATVFVDRRSVRSASSMVHSTAEAIDAGYAVVAFPEGTSSDGTVLGSFHANIFESAIRTGTAVQPLCLRYTDAGTGAVAAAAHFIGDMTLVSSLASILGSPRIRAQVQFGACIEPQGHSRKSLALQAHQQVRGLLASAV